MSRYVVFGAGAVGGVIGARLADSGQDVLLVARGPHFEAIAQSGLRIDRPGGSDVRHLPVVQHVGDALLGAEDTVILATKSHQSQTALVALASSAPPEVTLVCAQNGVENERAALRRFPNVYGCLVVVPATHLQPGVVSHVLAPVPGVLDIGRAPGGRDEIALRISADLNAAGFESEIVEDIMAWKRRKLLTNLGNAVDALFPPGEAAERLVDRAQEEGRACLAAAHLDTVAESAFEQRLAVLREQPYDARLAAGSSSRQSLARATGSIESDYLNGEIVLLGRLHGVPTPVNAALQRLANQHAARRLPPGSLDIAALDRLLTA